MHLTIDLDGGDNVPVLLIVGLTGAVIGAIVGAFASGFVSYLLESWKRRVEQRAHAVVAMVKFSMIASSFVGIHKHLSAMLVRTEAAASKLELWQRMVPLGLPETEARLNAEDAGLFISIGETDLANSLVLLSEKHRSLMAGLGPLWTEAIRIRIGNERVIWLGRSAERASVACQSSCGGAERPRP